MITIDANGKDFKELNELIRSETEVTIDNCLGQRFIASGMSGKSITVNGVPGNALGSYLNGADITVNGNAQDAAGDTMNDGRIIVRGSVGDAAGYAMRGGEIYVRDNAGYRAGIHMKAYKDKLPVMVIGGVCGSFLGEYQAGGLIIVLGINASSSPIVSNFCGTGMHGGKIFLRCDEINFRLPKQVKTHKAADEDKEEIKAYIENYCKFFGGNAEELLKSDFFVLTPDSGNPYKQLYVQN